MQDFFLLRLEHFKYALAPQGRIQLFTKGGVFAQPSKWTELTGEKSSRANFSWAIQIYICHRPPGTDSAIYKGGFGPILKYGPN